MEIYQYSKTEKIIIAIFSLTTMVVGFYLAVYQSHYYNSNNFMIGLTLVLISCYMLVLLRFKIEFDKNKLKIGLFTLLIFIVSHFTLHFSQENYIDTEVKNGIEATAIVTEVKPEIRGKQTSIKLVVLNYFHQGKKITQSIEDYEKIYKINDSIKIKYSKTKPEIFKVIENN